MGDELERCPGCGIELTAVSPPVVHPYFGSSPSCWRLYGELLAREFQDPAYFPLHQMTVDVYAVQHPGVEERRSARSVALHLMTLALWIEGGADPLHGPVLHRRMVGALDLGWLEPPNPNGTMTAADVLEARSPDEHLALVRAWGEDVWRAWSRHHDTVLQRLREAGFAATLARRAEGGTA